MEMLERALEIARAAHAGQVDKAGRPYIEHVLRVVDAVEGEDAKTCCRCRNTLPLADFNLSKCGKHGRHNHCRVCQKDIRHDWYVKNRDSQISSASAYGKTDAAVRARKDRYDSTRKIYLEKQRARVRGAEARAKARVYEATRFAEDQAYRLSKQIRISIRCIILGQRSDKLSLRLVGCDRATLRAHLEQQFRDGMSWSNYGYYGWHVDHRRPFASFDLSVDEQRQECCHFTNLQPLFREENQRKGAHVD